MQKIEPTTYNVLKPSPKVYLDTFHKVEPTTYNVLKPNTELASASTWES